MRFLWAVVNACLPMARKCRTKEQNPNSFLSLLLTLWHGILSINALGVFALFGEYLNSNASMLFRDTKKDLPNSGQAFIYKYEASNAWESVISHLSQKIDYTDIEKILTIFESKDIVVYTKDNNLKVHLSAN